MDFIAKHQKDIELCELAEKIEKAFLRYHVYLEITDWVIVKGKIIFLVKLKGDTRESQMLARMHDVQLRLKFPVFSVINLDFNICLVVSAQKDTYENLCNILTDSDYAKVSENIELPYIVGHNIVGERFITDLSRHPHLLIAGSSNSGKTVGLKSLIVSIAHCKPPCMVNFVLIDVGATNLIPFDSIPHLSCPVIRERSAACNALVSLKGELERRIALQISDPYQYEALPRIILVVDEFPALFTGLEDKKIFKLVVDAVSSLLQRGRHGKIHVVLAAQNPTVQNMRVDLGNITARIAFRCAKRNFSETILGVGGAENLLGQGDLYFKSPEFDGLQRLHGAFISDSELKWVLSEIKDKWTRLPYVTGLVFTISEADLQRIESNMMSMPNEHSLTKKQNMDDKLFAEVILWTIGQNSISCNTIMKIFGLGWNRASRFIDKLNYLGIVDALDAKLPRMVLPQSLDDIPTEVMEFLESNGFSTKVIAEVISDRV